MENLLLERLIEGNRRYLSADTNPASFGLALRRETAENGQKPHTVVVCCSDSRVVPESIFSAGLGELFVIRVAGNVLGAPQIGSIEYAAAHLGCKLIVVLGHTQCGAVRAAIDHDPSGFIKFITDEIKQAIGKEKDDYTAALLNVRQSVRIIESSLEIQKDEQEEGLRVVGAMYRIEDGIVEFDL